MAQPCPLCWSKEVAPHGRNNGREFYLCGSCRMVFVDRRQLLSSADERHRYEQHNNDVNDPRYREFLSPLRDIVRQAFSREALGLDFGAGTGPALSALLEEEGFQMRQYDTFFWPDKKTLDEKYDFVVASEVVEHFAKPREEFRLLRQLLKPGGMLAIMTLLYPDALALSDWYYLKDPTHVCAYGAKTFAWIAKEYEFSSCEVLPPRIAVLRVG